MRQSSPETWRRSVVGASLALLTVVLIAPAKIEASCAHYVIWRGVPRPAPLGLELLGPDVFARAEADGVPATPPPTDRPPPCTGVLCSGAPATPQIPSSPYPPAAEHWGVLSEPAPSAPDGPADSRVGDAPLSPILGGSGVFHPPRPAH